jgi:hypothetical protein
VLLFLIIQRLFSTKKFRVFDFGGMALEYKSFFATGYVDYVKVIWLPMNAKNLVLVLAHYIVLQAWRGAAVVKQAGKFCICMASALISRPLLRPPADHRELHASEKTDHSGADTGMSKRARPNAVRQ